MVDSGHFPAGTILEHARVAGGVFVVKGVATVGIFDFAEVRPIRVDDKAGGHGRLVGDASVRGIIGNSDVAIGKIIVITQLGPAGAVHGDVVVPVFRIPIIRAAQDPSALIGDGDIALAVKCDRTRCVVARIREGSRPRAVGIKRVAAGFHIQGVLSHRPGIG